MLNVRSRIGIYTATEFVLVNVLVIGRRVDMVDTMGTVDAVDILHRPCGVAAARADAA